MLRNAVVLCLAAGAALTASHPAVAAGYFAPEPPSITGEPFAALVKTQSTTLFADGNRIVRTNAVHYYRDSQGRTRTDRSGIAPDGSIGRTMITISDPVSAQRYVLYPQSKLAVVRPIRLGPTGSDTTDPADDLDSPFALLGFGMGIGAQPLTEASVSETSLGEEMFQGTRALGTRIVRTIPAGVLGNEMPITSTLERWISPELGVPVQITQKSSIGGEVTLTVEQLVRAEQETALFAPPADYRLREINLPVPPKAAAPSQSSSTGNE